MKINLILVLAVVLAVGGVCFAQPAEPVEPAQAGAEDAVEVESVEQPMVESQEDVQAVDVQLLVTVVGMQGLVQYRVDEDGDWLGPKVGQELPVGVEFRTGPRSAVRLAIPPDQTVTLDRLGTVKVLQALFDAKSSKVKTDIGLPYGRVTYEVEAAGVEHDSTIHSPGATLAIRGTEKVTLYDQGSRMIVGTASGTHTTFKHGHIKMVFGQKKKASVTAKSKNAAEQARRAAGNGDELVLALTESERRLIERSTSGFKRERFVGTGWISFNQYAKKQKQLRLIEQEQEEQPDPDRIPGDLNYSGIVDGTDNSTFNEYYKQPMAVAFEQGDINENGAVSLHDLDIFGKYFGYYREDKRIGVGVNMAFPDATGDGKVNYEDMNVLDEFFGNATDGGVACGDFNGDGKVNLLDLDGLGKSYIGYWPENNRSEYIPDYDRHEPEYED